MTSTLPTPPTPLGRRAPRLPAPVRPSGPTWAVLRLHRTALVLWGLALLAAVVALVWMYAIGDEARRGTAACGYPSTTLPGCTAREAITADETYSATLAFVGTALSYLILPVAAWAGGALVAHELESGTARLAWTQAMTPTRWLASRLALPAALLTAGTTAVVLLVVRAQQDGDPNLVGDWYAPDVFVSTGPVAVAHVLAGLALGALAGLLTRRTLTGAGLALAAALLLHNALEWFRASLWPATTVTGPHALDLPRSVQQLENGAVTAGGERIGDDMACVGSDSAADLRRCKARTGLTDFWATYHPKSDFWPLQLTETAVVLGVAALATAAAFTLLRRRTAA
ncbi:hypothetical protein ACFY93_31615 [Streptomyces sp. NPDC008313]|uniref:hypothetical protein n=1 Tax=Streptomyces sp. NPDC008313 TaxID=3364826 RepID=UPI0036EFB55B